MHDPGQRSPTAIFNAGVVACYNESSEEIPPYSIVRVSGFTTDREEPVLKVNKPNTYGSQYGHMITGPLKIAVGGYGVCQADWAICTVDGNDSAPNIGENWGPVDDSWKLRKRSGGWRIMGQPSSGRALVRLAPLLNIRVRLTEALAAGSNATASVYDVDGDTTYDVEVYDRLEMEAGYELPTDTYGYARWFEDWDKWLFTESADCEEEA